MSALQAVKKASHCHYPNPQQQNPQTGRQKGKGRVCLGEDGDSKEEDRERKGLGARLTCSIGRTAGGRS